MRIQTTSLVLLFSFGCGLKIVSGSEYKDVKANILDSVSLDKYPRELARDMASKKIGLIKSILAEKEEEDGLHKSTFVVEALEEKGPMDSATILQSPVCRPFVTEIIVHSKKLVDLGEETTLDLFCSDSDREMMSSVLMGKTNDMVKDVLFGNPDLCHEAFEMMKIGQKKQITQSLSDKASCEAEVKKELESLRQVGDESDERVNWGAVTNIARSVVTVASSALLSWLN